MKTPFQVVLLVAVVIAAVAVLASFLKKRPPAEWTAGIDMEAFKKTDTNLLLRIDAGFIEVRISNLTAIAVGADDDIYVAGEREIAIMAANGKRAGGFEVEAPIRCLAAMPAGDLLVGLADHVEIYGRDGNRRAIWQTPAPKTAISSAAVSPEFVFVADYGNRIVWRYDHAGKLAGRIGDRAPGREYGFVIPNVFFDVAAARDGTLWAVNPGIRRLEHFTADGRFLGSWGETSLKAPGFCGCCNPAHIALMGDGSFVTSEKHIVRIKIYDKEGNFRGIVAGHENFAGDSPGLDLAVDSRGRILALDSRAGGVRIYTANKLPGE